MGRNGLFILAALMDMPAPVGIISLGIHAGTPYYDCSPEFMSKMQAIVDGYTRGRVSLAAPFLSWSKWDIYQYSRGNGLPIKLTYSCELGRIQPCGTCRSCADLEVLYAREIQ
jgi:7-cyano-7-deazaguanine synthase